MNTHVEELLLDLALGQLADGERAQAEHHVASCATCSDDLASMRAALGALPFALPPSPPPPSLRAVLLAAIAVTPQERAPRFARFSQRVAAMLDVAVDAARDILAKADVAASWLPGFTPDITLIHLQGGPSLEGAMAGLVTLKAGATFPMHRHFGAEWGMILQGTQIDDDGTVFHVGDEPRKDAESQHSFRASDDEDLVYIVVLREGLEIGGESIRADDPRV